MSQGVNRKAFVTIEPAGPEPTNTPSPLRTRAGHPPRYLFDCWREVAERLREARQLVLFLDFDGTLATLSSRPENASLREPTRRVLRCLARRPCVRVYIISGRRLADLQSRVQVWGVRCLGLHGWERNRKAPSLGTSRKPLHQARTLIEERLAGLPGVWVEDKGLSFVVHYRGAPEEVTQRAEVAVRDVLQGVGPKVRRLEADKAWEILPRQAADKGQSVQKLLAEFRGLPLTLYIGDDASDEFAFSTLRRGITIRVGTTRLTQAEFYLSNPTEVTNFLKKAEEQIACR